MRLEQIVEPGRPSSIFRQKLNRDEASQAGIFGLVEHNHSGRHRAFRWFDSATWFVRSLARILRLQNGSMKAVNLVTFHEGFLARKSTPPTTLALSIKL
jgi:hypothetical protein